MKFLGTDFKRKYIIFVQDGKEVIVSFNETFWRGIHQASIRVGGAESNIKIKSTYPGFIRRTKERMLLIRMFLKNLV